MHTLIMLTYSNYVSFLVMNFAIGVNIFFGTTKTRTIEGLEVKLEL